MTWRPWLLLSVRDQAGQSTHTELLTNRGCACPALPCPALPCAHAHARSLAGWLSSRVTVLTGAGWLAGWLLAALPTAPLRFRGVFGGDPKALQAMIGELAVAHSAVRKCHASISCVRMLCSSWRD
jgi:hypothetical protein